MGPTSTSRYSLECVEVCALRSCIDTKIEGTFFSLLSFTNLSINNNYNDILQCLVYFVMHLRREIFTRVTKFNSNDG